MLAIRSARSVHGPLKAVLVAWDGGRCWVIVLCKPNSWSAKLWQEEYETVA